MKTKCCIGIIIAVFALFMLSSCGEQSKDKEYEFLINKIHEQMTDDPNYYIGTDFKIAVGLWPKDSSKEHIDVDDLRPFEVTPELYEKYIEMYGIEDLLEYYDLHFIGLVPDYYETVGDSDDDSFTKEYDKEIRARTKQCREMLMELPEYKEHLLIFDGKEIEKNKGAEGYYSGEKDESSSYQVSGEFNDEKNNNEVYTGSHTNKSEVSYYGDWKVEHSNGARYNEGEFGYDENGEFKDEAASWDYYDDISLSYKGQFIDTVNVNSLDAIYMEYILCDNMVFYWEHDEDKKIDELTFNKF